MSSSLPRKRPRPTKSCSVCRARKIKCDHAKPVCGGCIKRKKPELCHYENQWLSSFDESMGNPPPLSNTGVKADGFESKVSRVLPDETNGHNNVNNIRFINDTNFKVRQPKEQELLAMNERIRQLEQEIQSKKTSELKQDDEQLYGESEKTIDFYRNLFPSDVKCSQGPLSWVSLLTKDVYLHSCLPCARSSADARESIVGDAPKSRSHEGFLQKWKIENLSNCKATLHSKRDSREKDPVSLANNYFKDLKLVWLLFDKFFDSELFFVMSFVNKEDLEESLSQIIGPREEAFDKVSIKKKYQLSIIGTVLLIMRMSSLTMYNLGKKPYFPNGEISEDDQYIIDHPVSKKIINVVNKCHRELLSFKEPCLEIFQFEVLRVYFSLFSPEDCDCVELANAGSVGSLMHYAVFCGLNRDPTSSSIGPLKVSEKNINLVRRLWYKIVYLDSHRFMLVGSPPIIDSKFYDTHFPHLDESKGEVEYFSDLWFYERAKLNDVCHPLLMLILNVRENPKISQVKKLCVPLVRYIETLGTFEEIMLMPYETVTQRAKKFQEMTFVIDTNSLLYMVYYHLFLFYNERRDKAQSLYYLLQICKISSNFYKFILFLEPKDSAHDLKKHFGSAVLLFPKIELTLHRVAQLHFSILIRISILKLFKKELPLETTMVLDDIVRISYNSCSSIIARYVNISDTYYHAWVVSKMHAYILSKLVKVSAGTTTPSFEFINANIDMDSFNKSKHHDSMFLNYQLEDFIKIRDEIQKFQDVEDGSKRLNKNASMQPWDSQAINENDKKWIEQMINGTFDSNSYSKSNGDTDPSTSISTDSPTDPIVPNNKLDNLGSDLPDGLIDRPLDTNSLNDVLNVNLDWAEIDRLFFEWNTNYGSFKR